MKALKGHSQKYKNKLTGIEIAKHTSLPTSVDNCDAQDDELPEIKVKRSTARILLKRFDKIHSKEIAFVAGMAFSVKNGYKIKTVNLLRCLDILDKHPTLKKLT